jgi:homoserine dehydrogenase
MKIIKIAIFGLGVVGSHVVKLLEKNAYILDNTKFKIVSISAKNKNKKRNFTLRSILGLKIFRTYHKIINQI